MTTFIDDLGRSVLREWEAAGRSERAFAEIAARALDARRPWDHLDARSLLRETLADVAPLGVPSALGGEPPTVRLFERHDVVISLRFWFDQSTTVHSHDFAGAFVLLEGASLHTTYRVDAGERPRQTFALCRVEHDRSEVLEPRVVRRIVPGEDFVHALYHLAEPTVTLIVQTFPQPGAAPQMSYFRAGLATAEAVRDPTVETYHRCLATRHRLDPESLAADLTHLADRLGLERLFALLRRWHRELRAAGTWEQVLAAATRVHGERHVETLARALDEELRAIDLVDRRRDVTHPDLRLLLGLLLHAPARDALHALVAARCSGDPRATLVELVERCIRVTPSGAVELLDLEIDADGPPAELVAALRETVRDLVTAPDSVSAASPRESAMHDALGRAARRDGATPALREAVQGSLLAPLFG